MNVFYYQLFAFFSSYNTYSYLSQSSVIKSRVAGPGQLSCNELFELYLDLELNCFSQFYEIQPLPVTKTRLLTTYCHGESYMPISVSLQKLQQKGQLLVHLVTSRQSRRILVCSLLCSTYKSCITESSLQVALTSFQIAYVSRTRPALHI